MALENPIETLAICLFIKWYQSSASGWRSIDRD